MSSKSTKNDNDLEISQVEQIEENDQKQKITDGGSMNNNSQRFSIEKPNQDLLDEMLQNMQNKFIQLEYTNPETSITILYNLYIPENYDSSKEYPLITFIHDSSVVGNNITNTLTQGFGGIIWATDEEQAKHECFVLAPQFQTKIANDDFEINEEGKETINLINNILNEYNIDKNRLYITGQSMGYMTAMALNIEYPDLFASSLYVAGQWDANQMNVLSNHKIFYLVSEGNRKASPGIDDFINVLNKENVNYSFATWNGRWDESEFNKAVEEILSENNSINLVKFELGTVTLNDDTNSSSEHTCTWSVAYLIEGVRDWLFAQTK